MEFSAATKSSRHCAFRCCAAAFWRSPSPTPFLRDNNGIQHLGDGPGRTLQESVVTILDSEHTRLQLLLGHGVTGLASTVQIEERALHPVITHLERADALVRQEREPTVGRRHALRLACSLPVRSEGRGS